MANQNQNGSDLWAEALTDPGLAAKDKDSIKGIAPIKLDELLHSIETQRDTYRNQRTTFKGPKGERVVLSDIFAKVAKWIKKFVEVGDTAVQFDPGHAALPWAAVRFILQTSLNHAEQHAVILEGVETVARVLAWSKIQESLYLGQKAEAVHLLKADLVRLYVTVLSFLAKAYRFYCKRSSERAFGSVFKSSDHYSKKVHEISSQQHEIERYAVQILAAILIDQVQASDTNQSRLFHAFKALKTSHLKDSDAKQTKLLESLQEVKFSLAEGLDAKQSKLLEALEDQKITLAGDCNATQAILLETLQDLRLKVADDSHAIQSKLLEALQDLKRPFSHVQTVSTTSNGILKDLQRDKILDWVSSTRHQSHHSQIYKKVLKGTGEWLLRSPELYDWLDSSSSQMMWLHGIPGSGKSRLVSILAHDMKESHGHLSGTMPTYSYCGMVEQRPLESKPETIFRSLIRQLIVSESELPEPILRWYGKRDEQSDNPLGEAVRLIKEIASERSVTYILLDAVDECDGDERGEILKGLEEILQQCSTLIKIFVSSRNDHDFSNFFSGYPHVSIKASKNQGDIEMYINKMVHDAIVEKPKKLLSTVDVSDSFKDQIKRTLREGAQGMFLWVELQLQYLCTLKSKDDVEDRLGHLPPTLIGVYGDIYSRNIETLAENSKILVENIVQWLLCCQESLEIDVLMAAVTASSRRKCSTKAQVLDLTANLVTHDEELNVFRFAHLSVKEYLEEVRMDFASPRNHKTAAIGSLRLLTDDTQSLVEEVRHEGRAQNPQAYASKYWSRHLMQCGDQKPMEEPYSLLQEFAAHQPHWCWQEPNFAEYQDNNFSKLLVGTGAWLLKSSEMNTWKSRTGDTLFLSGGPGFGKTVLTSITIDHLQEQFADEAFAVAYVYCNLNEQSRQSSVYLVFSLLRQLVQQKPSLANLREISDDRHDPSTRTAIEHVFALLRHSGSSFERIFIVVDGLDELLHEDLQEFLAKLHELQSCLPVNLMIVSRPHSYIEAELRTGGRLLECIDLMKRYTKLEDVEICCSTCVEATLYGGK